MILSGYILEVIIIWFWYTLIVKKEIYAKTDGTDKIIKRTINLLIHYKNTIRSNLQLRVNYKQKKRQEIEKIKRYVLNLIFINVWIGCFFIMIPPIMNIFLHDKESVFHKFAFLIFVGGLLVKQLKEQTQSYLEVLEVYIKQVVVPLEKCPRIIEIEKDEIIDIQWTSKKKIVMVLVIIMGIVMYLLLIWGDAYLEQNEMAKGILTILVVAIWGIDFVKNKFKKREKVNKPIFISVEYDLIKDEVEHICSMLNIYNVRFRVVEENRINAFSKLNKDGVWEVSVTSQFITKLRKMIEEDKTNEKNVVMEIDDVKKIFLVTVVHELGHVFYKDEILEKRRILFSVFVSFGILIMAMFLLVFSVKSLFFAVVSSILLFVEWIFGSIMCDSRYWGQIAEFKADRIAAEYVEGGTEAFVYFWANDKKIQREGVFTQNILKENCLYKYYKRNIEIEKHPSWKYRRKLMEERNEWKWWEYFEYVLVIRKWRRKGLGWNGVLKVTGM